MSAADAQQDEIDQKLRAPCIALMLKLAPKTEIAKINEYVEDVLSRFKNLLVLLHANAINAPNGFNQRLNQMFQDMTFAYNKDLTDAQYAKLGLDPNAYREKIPQEFNDSLEKYREYLQNKLTAEFEQDTKIMTEDIVNRILFFLNQLNKLLDNNQTLAAHYNQGAAIDFVLPAIFATAIALEDDKVPLLYTALVQGMTGDFTAAEKQIILKLNSSLITDINFELKTLHKPPVGFLDALRRMAAYVIPAVGDPLTAQYHFDKAKAFFDANKKEDAKLLPAAKSALERCGKELYTELSQSGLNNEILIAGPFDVIKPFLATIPKIRIDTSDFTNNVCTYITATISDLQESILHVNDDRLPDIATVLDNSLNAKIIIDLYIKILNKDFPEPDQYQTLKATLEAVAAMVDMVHEYANKRIIQGKNLLLADAKKALESGYSRLNAAVAEPKPLQSTQPTVSTTNIHPGGSKKN